MYWVVQRSRDFPRLREQHQENYDNCILKLCDMFHCLSWSDLSTAHQSPPLSIGPLFLDLLHHQKLFWAIISKNVRNWRPKMPENNFNKVSTLWTCQTYMENMSKVLKPAEISFGVLFFRQILRQLRTFLKLLPRYYPGSEIWPNTNISWVWKIRIRIYSV